MSVVNDGTIKLLDENSHTIEFFQDSLNFVKIDGVPDNYIFSKIFHNPEKYRKFEEIDGVEYSYFEMIHYLADLSHNIEKYYELNTDVDLDGKSCHVILGQNFIEKYKMYPANYTLDKNNKIERINF